MSGQTPDKIYIAGFSYTARDVDMGQFQLIVPEKTHHRAEKKFLKKVRDWAHSFPELWPVRVFIQDLVEIDTEASREPVLFFDQKDRIRGTHQRTVFTALPLREPHANSWALSMPAEPVLFWESDSA